MKIGIMGNHMICERVIERLLELERNIVLIDKDEEFCKKISEKFGIPTLVGDYTQKEFLKTIEVETFDAFFVFGMDDKENLTTALLLKELGGKNIVILLEDDDYVNIAKSNNIEVILLKDVIIKKVLELLYKIEQITRVDSLYIFKVEAKNDLIGKRVFELKGNGDKFFVFAIKREDILLYPDSETVIKEGDIIYYVAKEPNVKIK